MSRLFEIGVMAMLLSGFLALMGSGLLDGAAAVALGGSLLVRLAIEFGWIRPLLEGRWLLALVVATPVLLFLDWRFLSHDGVYAVAHWISLIALIAIVRSRTRRDFECLIVVAHLEMVLAAWTASPGAYLLACSLFVPGGVIAFVAREQIVRRERPDLRRASSPAMFPALISSAVWMTVAVGLLATVLFFLLPRTARAAIRELAEITNYRLPGFADGVRLGEIGELRVSREPVMRVRFFSGESPRSLKWRGAVLPRFDGIRWVQKSAGSQLLAEEDGLYRLTSGRGKAGKIPGASWRLGHVGASTVVLPPDTSAWDAPEGRPVYRVDAKPESPPLPLLPEESEALERPAPIKPVSRRVGYEVRLQRTGTSALFFPAPPDVIRVEAAALLVDPSGAVRLAGRGSDGIRYTAYSTLGGGSIVDSGLLGRQERAELLHLPTHRSPRLSAYAREITAGADGPAAKAAAIERHLRRDFSYTLDLPSRPSPDPVAHFLFERKRGHCEYFASAMAVLLREIEIPARLATGFQGGEVNPLTEWMVIRASDAHSWVEAYIDGTGWVTFDPTPAGSLPSEMEWAARWRVYGEALETFWQEWVLDYNRERQFSLVASLSSGGFLRDRTSNGLTEFWNWSKAQASRNVSLWPVLLLMPVGIAALILGRRMRPHFASRWGKRRELRDEGPATRAYHRMLRVLAKRNLKKPEWFTPAEFASITGEDEAGKLVREITDLYQRQRYGGERAGNLDELVDRLDRLARA